MIQCAISEDQEKYIDHAIDREGDRKGGASLPYRLEVTYWPAVEMHL